VYACLSSLPGDRGAVQRREKGMKEVQEEPQIRHGYKSRKEGSIKQREVNEIGGANGEWSMEEGKSGARLLE